MLGWPRSPLPCSGRRRASGFVNFDNDVYVCENAKVAGGLSLKGVAGVFTHADCHLYHPLTTLSLMGNYQLHRLYAGGYHFANVAVHTASVILLFLVLRQMTGALWRSAFVAADWWSSRPSFNGGGSPDSPSPRARCRRRSAEVLPAT